MTSKKSRPPRAVPVLTPKQEALLPTPLDTLRSVTKPVAEAQVKAYVESHYPGNELPDIEPLTDAQYTVLEKVAPRERGQVINSIEDMLTPPAPLLHLQLANDFAELLSNDRRQQAVVQHLYNEIGQSSVAALLGVKK